MLIGYKPGCIVFLASGSDPTGFMMCVWMYVHLANRACVINVVCLYTGACTVLSWAFRVGAEWKEHCCLEDEHNITCVLWECVYMYMTEEAMTGLYVTKQDWFCCRSRNVCNDPYIYTWIYRQWQIRLGKSRGDVQNQGCQQRETLVLME